MVPAPELGDAVEPLVPEVEPLVVPEVVPEPVVESVGVVASRRQPAEERKRAGTRAASAHRDFFWEDFMLLDL